MGKLDGKVAFITGAARGQGRSHAVRLAEEGADIVALDICAQIDTVPYPLATTADLKETVAQVEALGRKIVAVEADVRDLDAVRKVAALGVAELGSIDIIVANAGICPLTVNPVEQEWHDVIGVNLTGAYNTVAAAVPSMISRDRGGSIVLIGSTSGLNGVGANTPGGLGYIAAKHGLVGLMRGWANFLAEHSIRVNSVHPTGVATPMVVNDTMPEFLATDTRLSKITNALPVDVLDPIDISNAIAWLVSDEGRYVTGVALPVDAGFTNKK